jgi:hypothetical protein
MIRVKITIRREEFASLIDWLNKFAKTWQYDRKQGDGGNDAIKQVIYEANLDYVNLCIEQGTGHHTNDLTFLLDRPSAMLARLSWEVEELTHLDEAA